MTFIQAIEILALVSGIAYAVLEILQKRAMWVVGLLTGAACAFSFGVQHVWASMGLNLYYLLMSVVGLVQWKKAEEKLGEEGIHLAVIPRKVCALSAGALPLGVGLLTPILHAAGGAYAPLDAIAVTISVIATWWLTQSYLQQWLLWIAADVCTTTLCILTGQWWMAALYLCYMGSAVYGYFHWKKDGKYVNLEGDSSLRSE